MPRYLLLFATGIAAVVLSYFAAEMLSNTKIDARLNVPQSMQAGGQVEVKVMIDKGTLSGLARFQQKIPYGFSAKSIASANADFSVDGRMIRLVWLSLPSEPIITVTYQLIADKRIAGKIDLSGSFSYIDSSSRQTVDILPQELTITPSPDIDPKLVVDVHDQAKLQELFGHDKLIASDEMIPISPSAKAAATTAATASQNAATQDAVAKSSSEIAATQAVGTKPSSKTAATQAVGATASSASQVTAPVAAPSAGTTKSVAVAETNISGANVSASAVVAPDPALHSPITKAIRSSEIVFRVQLAAARRPIGRYFFTTFNLENPVDEARQNGWYKYMIGEFDRYEDAQNQRLKLTRTTVLRPFVVAYKGERRITVPQALRLTGQKAKWVRE